MISFFFPHRLARISFLLRVIIIDIVALPATLNIYNDQYSIGDAIIMLLALTYAVFYIYLPRLRDAAIPVWLLILAVVPIVSKLFVLLLLFKSSVIKWTSSEIDQAEQGAAANP
jgi:uncharacterized membrane protein YhaH (DUF805 family)